MRGKPGKKKKPVPNFDTFTNGQGILLGFPKITVTATVELVDDDRKYTIGIAGIGPGVPSGDYHVAFVHDGRNGAEVVKTFGISGFTECWYSTLEETNANFDPIDHVKLIKA